MDYTLVHYRIGAWERSAYEHVRDLLVEQGWPVAELEFDRELIVRGLILDIELGNIVKANRFGYVTRAFHGTGPLAFEDQRAAYRHTAVDLGEHRYVFLNTLFSLSEGCLYAQLVDLLDAGMIAGRAGLRRSLLEGSAHPRPRTRGRNAEGTPHRRPGPTSSPTPTRRSRCSTSARRAAANPLVVSCRRSQADDGR